MRLDKTIGTLAPGYEADIVALDGDPLTDITAVTRVAFVMRAGKVYKRQPKLATSKRCARFGYIQKSLVRRPSGLPYGRASQSSDQLDQILRQRRLEAEFPPVHWMFERQPVRVERLARKRNRPERVRPVRVALFADQRVASQPRLNADLIPPPRHQPHLDQRRALERLEHRVVADRLLAARIAGVGFLLNQRSVVPHQMVAPGAGRLATGGRTPPPDRPAPAGGA